MTPQALARIRLNLFQSRLPLLRQEEPDRKTDKCSHPRNEKYRREQSDMLFATGETPAAYVRRMAEAKHRTEGEKRRAEEEKRREQELKKQAEERQERGDDHAHQADLR